MPKAPEKTEGPSPVLTFAGIELDCSRNEARLPHEKVEKCPLAFTVCLLAFLIVLGLGLWCSQLKNK